MYTVLIPILFLVLVSTIKKIPVIGGNLIVAFMGSGLLALLLGQQYNMAEWVSSWVKSFNSIAFIALIILFGAIFSSLQMETGAMETVLNILRAAFGKTPQGLVLATLIALFFSGSLMGTVAAVGAVIGLLIVPAMDDIGIHPDLICAIIVTGGSMGGMMPPVSNAIILACSLVGIESTQALLISYVTVGIGLVVITLFFCKVYIGKKYSLPENLIPKEKAVSIFAKNWKKLIPLFVLIVLILLKSIPSIAFDLPQWLLSRIPIGDQNLFSVISGITIIGKITNNIVMSILIAIITCFIVDRSLYKKIGGKMQTQLKSIINPEILLVATAFFLGAFKIGGQNHEIATWAGGLNSTLLIIGGSVATILAGMLTGGQSTAQSMLTPILTPAWTAIGIAPLNIALASSHLAMAGQGLPPADINTFIIAGLVGSILGKKVNPLRSMLYSTPYCIYLVLAGLVFFFIK